MTLSLHPLSPHVGVEARGVDLRHAVLPEIVAELRRSWLDATVLLFRDQVLTPADLVRVTRLFGEPFVYTRAENELPGHREVLVLSNLTENGRPIGSPASGRYWHTDGHFLRLPPAASLLYAVEVPPTGGDTHFANMVAAYAALPEAVRARIDGRRVVISRVQSRPYNYPNKPPVTDAERAAWPDMPQPLVRAHPETGRRALYVGGNVPWRVEGMPDEESAPLVTELQSFAVRGEFAYTHRWRAGDLVMWDNRSTLHRATVYDQVKHRRLMHRTTIVGDEPFFA